MPASVAEMAITCQIAASRSNVAMAGDKRGYPEHNSSTTIVHEA